MSKRKPYEFAPPKKGEPVLWSSLETRDAEIAHSNELRERRAAEFAPGITDALDPVSRRTFLSLMSASVALATMEGCRRPIEHIMPYGRPPEGVMPGIAQTYATVIDRRGEAVGLVVESHEGRPTKIEGNPDHPASLGATDLLTQASVLDLYDPDRSQQPWTTVPEVHESLHGDRRNATWHQFDTAFHELIDSHRSSGGQGLRILCGPSVSPTFVRLRDQIVSSMPNARFHVYDACDRSNVREGARLAFGVPVNTVHDYSRARTIVSIDADFLQTEPGAVKAMRQYADGRRLPAQASSMNRLYVVESTLTTTGANADHRLRIPSGMIESYLIALAARIAQQTPRRSRTFASRPTRRAATFARWSMR
jgi:molybdopterin-containing oxidoreductase family iron-sulfur binding subunit